jgi:hypothetical protein
MAAAPLQDEGVVGRDGGANVFRCFLAAAPFKGPAPAIDKKLDALVHEHRGRLLELGAAGQLAMKEKLEVLPLDEEAALARAKPLTPEGRVVHDAEALEARHDSQVKAALESGPCAFVILGGAHDLSASVRRLGGGQTEYVRVTTGAYREATTAK